MTSSHHPQASLVQRTGSALAEALRHDSASEPLQGDGRVRRVSDLLDRRHRRSAAARVDRSDAPEIGPFRCRAGDQQLPALAAGDRSAAARRLGRVRCGPVRGPVPDRAARHPAASRSAGAARGRRGGGDGALHRISQPAQICGRTLLRPAAGGDPGARALAPPARPAARRARPCTGTSTSAAWSSTRSRSAAPSPTG